MKYKLETILKKYNIDNITHGIAYNISDLSQIKYWDKTGREIVSFILVSYHLEFFV